MPAGDSGEASRFVRTQRYANVRAHDKKLAAARNRPQYHYGPKGAVTKKDGGGDPVLGFLRSAAKAIEDAPGNLYSGAKEAARYVAPGKSPTQRKTEAVVKEVQRAGRQAVKGYVEGQVAAIKPNAFRSPRERQLVAQQGSMMDVSPGMISALIKAGGGSILKPGRMPLNKLSERLPVRYGKGTSSKRPGAFRTDPRRQTGDINVKDRVPWLVDRTTGEVHVGHVGANHGALYPRGRSMGDFRQGWLYNPIEDYANITLGTGNPMTKFSPQEEKGLYQLLHYFIGRDSPITDEMVQVSKQHLGTGSAPLGARQGSRADEMLDRIGGQMSSKEFQEFLQQELRRKRKR